MLTRGFLLGGTLALLAGLTAGCGSPPPQSSPGFRVVVLGVDGLDPALLRQWLDELPHLKALAAEGTFREFQTSDPPQSGVAWASFTTGRWPDRHGLFDSISRSSGTYAPMPAYGRLEAPWALFGMVPLRGLRPQPSVAAEPYWKTLDVARITTLNLRAPLALPPHPLTHGRTLAGLGVPDIRQTWGTHTYLASDLSSWDLLDADWGEVQVELDLEDGKAQASIEGPPVEGAYSTVPVEFELDSDHTGLSIRVQGQVENVAESSWSDWFRFEFPSEEWRPYQAVGRFFVLETFPELRLYLTPLSPDPADPPFQLSSPEGYSRGLADRFGRFETPGASAQLWAVDLERLDEETFLQHLNRETEFWSKVLLAELEAGDTTVVSAFFDAPDAAAHLLFRSLDPQHPRYDTRVANLLEGKLAQVYRRVDALVGEVRARLQPQDVLLVVSDHGFHSWQKDFNPNAWLRDHGYLRGSQRATREEPDGWQELFTGQVSTDAIDWGKTEAFAVGFSSIYVNLMGREPQGLVEPGEDYRELVEKLRRELMDYRDPDTGEAVVARVVARADRGEAAPDRGPDLIVGLHPGYRVSWQSSLGMVAENVLVANLRKWSGDHSSSAAPLTPGVFLCSRRLSDSGPVALVDFVPSLLQVLGVAPPAGLDGKDLGLDGP